ncbi:MAG: hypothetical protein U5K56_09370 [Halioglobus sp.]|nr:hypothetical protein [Halioglobus sp.]
MVDLANQKSAPSADPETFPGQRALTCRRTNQGIARRLRPSRNIHIPYDKAWLASEADVDT